MKKKSIKDFSIDDFLPKPITKPSKAPEGMRIFTVARLHDISGVSGTGVVCQGVIFATGDIAVQWLTPPPRGDVQIKRDLEEFLNIHVRSHPENITVLTYNDKKREIFPDYISLEDIETKTMEELQKIIADKEKIKQDAETT